VGGCPILGRLTAPASTASLVPTTTDPSWPSARRSGRVEAHDRPPPTAGCCGLVERQARQVTERLCKARLWDALRRSARLHDFPPHALPRYGPDGRPAGRRPAANPAREVDTSGGSAAPAPVSPASPTGSGGPVRRPGERGGGGHGEASSRCRRRHRAADPRTTLGSRADVVHAEHGPAAGARGGPDAALRDGGNRAGTRRAFGTTRPGTPFGPPRGAEQEAAGDRGGYAGRQRSGWRRRSQVLGRPDDRVPTGGGVVVRRPAAAPGRTRTAPSTGPSLGSSHVRVAAVPSDTPTRLGASTRCGLDAMRASIVLGEPVAGPAAPHRTASDTGSTGTSTVG
jgi:hypothetical protein